MAATIIDGRAIAREMREAIRAEAAAVRAQRGVSPRLAFVLIGDDPVAIMLMHENATVTICHSRTRHLAAVCRRADILVVAIGRARLVTAEFVKPGAAVIDVGNSYVDGKVVGDVDFDTVAQVAGLLSPVPGG